MRSDPHLSLPARPAFTRAPAAVLMVVAAATLAAACTETTSVPPPDEIELFTWWTAGGEANALAELIALFGDQHPNDRILGTAATGSSNARATLQKRMIGGQPPDTFQASGGWDLLRWVLYNGHSDGDSKMEPIDDLAASQGWAGVIPKPVMDTVSFNGHVYAVPLNVHRVNTLFYNKVLFDQHRLDPPAS